MTMYQPCDVVPSHSQSRGDTSVFVEYNEEGVEYNEEGVEYNEEEGCWLCP